MASLDPAEQTSITRVDIDAQAVSSLSDNEKHASAAEQELTKLLSKIHSGGPSTDDLDASNSIAGNPKASDLKASLIGCVIDRRFRILSALGKGGMSEVFKAEHMILQKTVAVKILHIQEANKANSVERFQQEAKAVSTLDHRNIVTVHAFGFSENDRLYLAMDYLEGNSLFDLVEAQGHIAYKRALDLAIQIASGLEHAHSRGVVHRDLKPSNIVLQVDEFGKDLIKIVDFGIARFTNLSGKEIKQLTLEGNTCGSPPYMSPEQCMGEPVDARSDIYSFGCLMYELLSGRRPFYASTAFGLMQKHLDETPRLFQESCPQIEIPQALESIVRKCLLKDPELRFQSMSELCLKLKELSNESVFDKNDSGGFNEKRGLQTVVLPARLFQACLLPALGAFVAAFGWLFYLLPILAAFPNYAPAK